MKKEVLRDKSVTNGQTIGLNLKVMIESFVIVHRKQEAKASSAPLALPWGPWILWKTCLRQMALGFHDASAGPLNFNLAANVKGRGAAKSARTQVFYGEDAYQFLLEVVCGLHSPMVGETEVAGQFKELLETLEVKTMLDAERSLDSPIQFHPVSHHDKNQFQRLLSQVLADAKSVRQNFLRELGGRSYGSLLRKHVVPGMPVNFIGAGHLVREIVPWLQGQAQEMRVFCRRPAQAQPLVATYPYLSIHKLPIHKVTPEVFGVGLNGVVVIAAPIESNVLHGWLKAESFKVEGFSAVAAPSVDGALGLSARTDRAITQIIDLRDTASSDPLVVTVPVLKLHDLFDELSLVEKETQARIKEAKLMIATLAQKRGLAAENRPFGWEDLCG